MAELVKRKNIPAKNYSLENCTEQWQKIRYVANVYFSIVDNATPAKTDAERLSMFDLSKDSDFEHYFCSPFIMIAAVNMSFAIELGLKAILSKKGIQYKRIHKLDRLYALLPTDIKSDLFKLSKSIFKINGKVLLNYGKIKQMNLTDNLEERIVTFDEKVLENLKEIQNINVEFRYVFEKQNKEKIKTYIDKSFTFLEMYFDIRNYINFDLDDN